MGIPAGSYFVRATDSPIGWMFKGAMYRRDLSEHAVEVRDDLTGMPSSSPTDGLACAVSSPARSGRSMPLRSSCCFRPILQRWRAYTGSPADAKRAGQGEWRILVCSVPVGEYYLTAIADEDGADWQDPQVLDVLSRSAMRLMMNDGDQKTITIRRRTVVGDVRLILLALFCPLAAASSWAQTPRDRPQAAGVGAGRIAGRVVSVETEPKPLRRARVTLNGSALQTGRTAITSDDGSFAFDGLPPGQYARCSEKRIHHDRVRRDKAGPPGTAGDHYPGVQQMITIAVPRAAA